MIGGYYILDVHLAVWLRALSALALFGSLIVLAFVILAERRRNARTELRRQMYKIVYFGPDMAERALAEAVFGYLENQNFDGLERLSVDRYAINHFCDLRFKYRLYEYFMKRMSAAPNLSVGDLELAVVAINNWSKQADQFDANLKEHFKLTSPMYRNTRYLARFLQRRPLYFKTIIDLFIIDTKEALLTSYTNSR